MNVLGDYEVQIKYENTYNFPPFHIQLYPSYLDAQYTSMSNVNSYDVLDALQSECNYVGDHCSFDLYFYDTYRRMIQDDFYTVQIQFTLYPNHYPYSKLTEDPILLYYQDFIDSEISNLLNVQKETTYLFDCSFVTNHYHCEFQLTIAGRYTFISLSNGIVSSPQGDFSIGPKEISIDRAIVRTSTLNYSVNNYIFLLVYFVDQYTNPVDVSNLNIRLFDNYLLESNGKQRSVCSSVPARHHDYS